MTKKIIYSPLFRTKDQFIASTLYAMGEKLDSLERVDRECFFLFENKNKCEQVLKKYFSDELKISPRLLFSSFKDIKTYIYN